MAALLAKHKLNRQILPLTTTCLRLLSDKVISLEVDKLDVLDTFTTDLIQRRTQKWPNKLKPVKRPKIPLVQPNISTSMQNLPQAALDAEFLSIISEENEKSTLQFLQRCKESQVFPSLTHAITMLDANSKNANVNIVTATKSLYDDQNIPCSECYKANGCFDHYMAEAYWLNGDIVKSLQLFEDAYKIHHVLRRRIRLMLKYLIMDVTTRSEAALVSIVKFCEMLHKTYKDAFPLVCLWQACFLSEWYSDQKLAFDLVERNDKLNEAIVGNLPYVVATALRLHQAEAVYKLVEMFIKFDMKLQYSAILVALFNYKFKQGDLKSCSEIIQWSVTYHVTLPQVIQERFLMLLLRRTNIDDVKPTKKPKPKFDLKF